MNIILVNIIYIIIICIVGVLFYILGSKKSKEQQWVDFNQQREQYAQQQRVIDSAIEHATQEYNNKVALYEQQLLAQKNDLEEAYNIQFEQLQQKLEEKQNEYNEKLAAYNNDLQNLRNTKAATIEAFQREEQIQKEKDNYRLDISKADWDDVQVLEGVRPRLNKPRILSMLIWSTFYQPIAKKKFALILGDKTVCGIYKITNTENQLCYIGQAKDVRSRWMEHCKKGLQIDTPQGNKLYQDMIKYGLQNFTFELLLECEPEQLNQQEQHFIEVYNSVNFGYNSRQQVK